MKYNLSIYCVDDDTIFGCISSDKKLLLDYLEKHDHEGSNISLAKHDGFNFTIINDPVLIYRELGVQDVDVNTTN